MMPVAKRNANALTPNSRPIRFQLVVVLQRLLVRNTTKLIKNTINGITKNLILSSKL